jgi:hypothetical protein
LGSKPRAGHRRCAGAPGRAREIEQLGVDALRLDMDLDRLAARIARLERRGRG